MLLTFLSPENLADATALLPPGLRLSAEVRAALPDLWRELLGRGQLHGMAIEDAARPPGQRVVGLGLSGFLHPEFADRFVRQPFPYAAAAIYEAERRGERILLTEAELAAANANGSLTLLVLHYGQAVWFDDPQGLAILSMGHAAFRFAHEGYGIARVFQEAYGPQRDFLRAGGFLLKSDYAAWYDTAAPRPPEDKRPYLMGLDRSDPESVLPGTTVSFLFQRRPARFGFSPAEQRVLLRALVVESDQHIAEQLDLSPNTLKSAWRSIYDRIQRIDAVLAGEHDASARAEAATRGREKRRRLLEYLRLHMEELRPVPRGHSTR